MKALVYIILFVLIVLGSIQQAAPSLSRYLTLVPDLISASLFLVFLISMAIYKTASIKPRYAVLAGLAVLQVLCGAIINSLDPGALVVGLRPYIKWIPMFLLPAAIRLSPESFRRQMTFVLLMAMIQFPLSFYQRFVKFVGFNSGDIVTGTLGDNASGALSVFLLSCIAVITAKFAKQQLSMKAYLFLFFVLFLPTTINETKVTFLLLPIMLIVPYLIAARHRIRVAQLIGVFAFGGAVIASVVFLYSFIPGQEKSFKDLSNGGLETYLYSGKGNNIRRLDQLAGGSIGVVTSTPEMLPMLRRFDALQLPFHVLTDDPVRLWTGLGIGNVTSSNISSLSGEYSGSLGKASVDLLFTMLLWETGLGGVLLFVTFLFFVLQDALYVSKGNTVMASFASGWFAVTLMFAIIIVYSNMFYHNADIYLFAYASGYIAFERYRQESSALGIAI